MTLTIETLMSKMPGAFIRESRTLMPQSNLSSQVQNLAKCMPVIKDGKVAVEERDSRFP